MKFPLILMAAVLAGPVQGGTAQVATQITQEYERAMQRWAMRLQTAIGPEAQAAAQAERPKAEEYGGRMWSELKDSLRAEWALEFTPWLLEVAPGLMTDTRGGSLKRSPLQDIMREVDLMHLKSPKVGPFCLALTPYSDPASLALVEKIEAENPDPQVKGQAALAQALLMKQLGNDPDALRRRGEAVKRAIINAADVKVGDTTVGEIAMNETYIVANLIQGRVAPEVSGRDIAGLPLKLSDFRGKVVVLAFWQAGMADAQQTIDLLTKLHHQIAGRPVVLLGVSRDKDETLRDLKAKGVLPWRNFADAGGEVTKAYRVLQPPQVFVLDQKGVIQYVGKPGTFVEMAVEDLLAPRAVVPALEGNAP